MKIGLAAPEKPSHLYMIRHRCLTSIICAFHLGFGLERRSLRSGGGDKALAQCPRIHRLGRQIPGVDGLPTVIAPAEDGENREPPQRPGHVAEQQVALAEDQGWSDDGLGNPHALQNLLNLPWSRKQGIRESGEVLATGKWTVLSTLTLSATSSSSLELSSACSKVVRPRPNRTQ